MILNAVLEITRNTGFESVNARSIAEYLCCSTRPIFTCYANMEELKKEFLLFAFAFYEKFVSIYEKDTDTEAYLVLPLSYLEFAKKETFLFKLLFINDMDLHIMQSGDFYQEVGNQKKAEKFSQMIGVSLEQGKEIFLDLFLYTHGMAVLVATDKLFLDKDDQEKRIKCILFALKTQWETRHE